MHTPPTYLQCLVERGISLTLHVDAHQQVHVGVHLDNTDADLIQGDYWDGGTVPVHVRVQGNLVWTHLHNTPHDPRNHAHAWAMAWLCGAYHAAVEAGECCERLAATAAGLLYRHQGKALQPHRWNLHQDAPDEHRRTPEEIAATATALGQMAGADPTRLITDALGAYTGVPAQDRDIY